jgi:Double zinc ribbon
MAPLGVFGIESSGLDLVVDLLILFVAVLYFALIYWTYADARRRIEDPMLVGCATVAALFPFVGPIVYMVLRPPEYLDDVRERELEIQAAEARLAELGYHLCPHCDYEVEREFLRCPNCMRKLRDPCPSCGKPLDPAWKICPFCEADLGAGAPTPRRTRRRRDGLLERPTAAGYQETSTAPPATERTTPATYAPTQGERGRPPSR